jgi:hypothetical protein
MSAGTNLRVFGPIWSSYMHKCILLLVLRFLWPTHTQKGLFFSLNSWKIGNKVLWHFSKRFWLIRQTVAAQGCQIFLGATYQNGTKYTELSHNIPNVQNIYQMSTKCTKCPYNIPNVHTIYQMSIQNTKCPQNISNVHKIYQCPGNSRWLNIFHCKTLHNLHKFGFLLWQYTPSGKPAV